ncbi:MAG TPA: DUF445 domain-containing protein [Acidimicrobiia bacterium]|jgi:uncharacterized membrane-anchored protein YjiN (DUF445 family)|nr:DUF445 domain-containing protein [Acidimicrobiia bacterium]
MTSLQTRTGDTAGGRQSTSMRPGPRSGPPVREEAQRIHRLRTMKRRATGLLVVMAVAFVVITVFGDDTGWTGYVQAAVAASLVGGVADWFAVTAVFRHPLGVPIPHTAVIVERKDKFGETLGAFVQENFLSSDAMTARLREAHLARRLGDWLADRAHAETVARHVADAAVQLADMLRDEDVQGMLHEQVRSGLENVPLAPLAGKVLRGATEEGRHQELFDAVLRGVGRSLDEHRETLRSRFEEESPWWVPTAIDHRIFDRLLDGLCSFFDSINADPDHELRARLDDWIEQLVERLEHSPEYRVRGEQLKGDLLDHPELRDWIGSLWIDAKAGLRSQAADPESELRQRLADAIVASGRQLRGDPALAAKVDDVIEWGVRYVGEHFHAEIAGLVSGTLARWDAEETSRKLEILLGPDLQFIRINGTVVGGLVGLGIHFVGNIIR